MAMHVSQALQHVHVRCVGALQKLEKLFPSDCRLTLLVRRPDNEDYELLFSHDDMAEVERAIGRFREREAGVRSAGPTIGPTTGGD